MRNEIWKQVAGYESFYEVSNMGRVRRAMDAPDVRSTKRGRLLNPGSHAGYKRVSLHRDGKCHREMVHRLVARAFLPAGRRFAQVNHIDGNKSNNISSNLEWTTPQMNVAHAWKIGLCKSSKGEAHGCSKLKERDIEVIRSARSRGVPLAWLAAAFNVTESAVSGIDRMAAWKHVGVAS